MASKKQVEVLKPEFDVYKFAIRGTTPLIVHAWDEKAKREMLEKQQGKKSVKRKEPKIPTNDFINSLYWLTEKPEDGADDKEAWENYEKAINDGAAFGFSIGGIKQSIIMGAYRSGANVVCTEMRGSLFIMGTGEHSNFDYAEIKSPNPPVMREDMVRIGGMSKTADIRFRAQFDEWEIPMTVRLNRNGKYSIDQFLSCVAMGGFATGIGEWRPERNGQFGMYELVY